LDESAAAIVHPASRQGHVETAGNGVGELTSVEEKKFLFENFEG
jgi:hypothetical protein